MVQLELLDFVQLLLLEVFELGLPLHVEILKKVITDVDVLLHLGLLNVCSEFSLVTDNFLLE